MVLGSCLGLKYDAPSHKLLDLTVAVSRLVSATVYRFRPKKTQPKPYSDTGIDTQAARR